MPRWSFIWCLLFTLPALAQVKPGAAYIPADANVYLHTSGELGVYGNVRNDGTLFLPAGAAVHFYGKVWENAATARIREESSDGDTTGGWVYFRQPNPLYHTDSAQLVRGGYNVATFTGATFPNVGVYNNWGIHLDDLNDMRVNHTLDLVGGSVYLDGWNLLVGDNDTGSIRHYSNEHFIVTNNGAGGYLYRDRITYEDRLVVFPVGTGDSAFTPAIVYNLDVPSRFRVHVGDSVYDQLTGGRNLWRTSAGKTWEVGKSTPGGSVYIALVHRIPGEGPLFDANRDSAYIARYNGNQGYDVGAKKTPVSPNPYTTGPPDDLGAVNDRRIDNFGETESFAKLVTDTLQAPQPTRLRFFRAYRYNDDSVYLDWGTAREFNCEGFEIERRMPDDTGFIGIGFVPSRSNDGYSYLPLDYHALDPKNFSGIILYRLKVMMYDGTYFYSDVQVVRGSDAKGEYIVWPNPSALGYINIYLGNLPPVKAIELLDVVGRRWAWKVYDPPLPAGSYIRLDVHRVPAGMYFLNLYDAQEHRSYSKKVILLRDAP
ncbi:MAG TPA: hypothetical protein VGC22_04790 [Chitinophaga sp.]